MLCFGIVLWIFCCHFKKRREAERRRLRLTNSPSVYVIPIYEEEQEDEEVMDIYEACFQPLYTDPAMSSGNVSPPPPYRVLLRCVVHIHTFIVFHGEDAHFI